VTIQNVLLQLEYSYGDACVDTPWHHQ